MDTSDQIFSSDRLAATDRLFSDEIESDLWIMFHGTSGFNAKSIERDGFAFRSDYVTHEQIKRVTDLYETMKWVGESGGGYPVLKPFSLAHDYLGGGNGLTFFAETSRRALLYATRDFAGGEKLRSLRIAFRDLDAYLGQSEFRRRHEEHMNKNSRALARVNAHPSEIEARRPLKVELDWLRDEMGKLADLRGVADEAYVRHDDGVVYAVRLTRGDTEGLRWNDSMGIESILPIPACKIAAKIVVPSDYEYDWADTGEEYLRRATSKSGLIAAITTR